MRNDRQSSIACCFAALMAGCAQAPPPAQSGSPGTLVINAATANQIEARYSESGQTIVLRSRLDRGVVASEVLDERGQSLSARATAIMQRSGAARGARTPLPQLFADATELGAALKLSRHAIRQMGDSLPPERSDSQLFARLSAQLRILRNALTLTKLGVLQEWGSAARRQIEMTPDESERFFAILQRRALTIGEATRNKTIRTVGNEIATSHDLQALLGPQRYAQYSRYRTKWIAGADAVAAVVPQ